MKLETVICELNPIHRGHQVVLSHAASNADVCAAVLSGNFVQRGEPALFDKYARAHAAMLAGADLVVELPFPWCSAGAEAFALGGVTVAAGLLSAGLTFGSETGDMAYIERLADIKASPDFAEIFASAEASSHTSGSASIFDEALRQFGVTKMPGANDKLAAEYVRFSRTHGMTCTAVERLREMKSATTLRSMPFADCAPYMPPESFARLQSESRCDYALYADILFRHARLYLRDTDHPVLQIAAKKARSAADASEFLRTIATKKYTAARMRRELLFSLADVSPDWLFTPPPYTLLLAANDRGRRYLSENRRRFEFPILTKPAAAPDSPFRRAHLFADELYELLQHLPCGTFQRRHPVMG